VACVRFNTGEFVVFLGKDGIERKETVFLIEPDISVAGYVDGLVNGAIRGWVYTQRGTGLKRGSTDLQVICDGNDLGLIKADKYRPDVASTVSCDPNCGFVFTPPPRYQDGKSHSIEFRVAKTQTALSGGVQAFAYPETMPDTKLASIYHAVDAMSAQIWRLKRELKDLLTRSVLTLDDYDTWARQYAAALSFRQRRHPWPVDRPQPLVSILCPVYRPRSSDFRAAVESVLAQTYQNWELILVDDCGKSPETTALIEEFCRKDSRVRALPQKKNVGISGATNVAIAAARGDYIALFDHDDLLADVAVEVMMDAALQTKARILYSDEDKIDDFGRFSDPNLKGAWNYRLLLGQNYVCHFLVVDAATLKAAGPLRKKYDGAQDHDLMLRLSELVRADEIVHVAEVIYHWRKTPGSTATEISAKSYAVTAGANAVMDHLKRRGLDATASSMLGVTVYDLEWHFKAEPSVAVIIPYREQIEITAKCVAALLSNTKYKNFRVILVDNWSLSNESRIFASDIVGDPRIGVVRVEEPFNYSRLNNLACLEVDVDYFVFMNNDVFVEQPDWLRKLVNEALADETVGAVGAKLVYPNRTVQHGGVILGVGGVGDHAYRGLAVGDPFFMGRGICAQELSAVTAALMLCRSKAFREIGGFDEAELSVAYNDVDLCLKLQQAGYKVVFCPAVIAEHHESISRGTDMSEDKIGRFVSEEQVMLHRWGKVITADPFYNPNFSEEGGIFRELSTRPLALTDRPLRFRVGPKALSRGVAAKT
jgi:GT2 family glycosyltransferase